MAGGKPTPRRWVVVPMDDRAGKRRLPDIHSITNSRRTVMQTTPFTIRAATAKDLNALARLATLDSQPALCKPALVAEIAGEPAAAIDLEARRIIADPFQPTAAVVEHLRLGASKLCGPPPKRPSSNRIAAVGALASIGVVMIASQAGAATPPDLATKKISGAPATLAQNASARLEITVVNRGGRAGKATKTDVLVSADRRRGKDIRIARVATKAFGQKSQRKLRANAKLPPGKKAGNYFVL